jgi:Peptidase family M23
VTTAGGDRADRIPAYVDRPAATVVGRRGVAGHSAWRHRGPGSDHHRLTIDPPAGIPPSGAAWTFTGPAVQVDQRSPVIVSPPLAGPGWAALDSCCDGPHRRAPYPIDGRWYLAQRFAIDFNQLDSQNRPGVGDPLLPSSFPTFGQPVYAVADGTVVVAVDGNPDLRVKRGPRGAHAGNAGGNRLVIDIGDGRFAVYAHPHKDSISVGPGDRVTRGHHIADVGSSGTTGGPHLHFQMTDRPRSCSPIDCLTYSTHSSSAGRPRHWPPC